jgi:hypothetical protein
MSDNAEVLGPCAWAAAGAQAGSVLQFSSEFFIRKRLSTVDVTHFFMKTQI